MSGEGTEEASMAPAIDGSSITGSSLSESERAAAFATGKAPIDRASALRAGSVPVPRKFIRLVIVAFAVLGVGGILAEKLIGNAGVGALISTPVTTLAGTGGTGRSVTGGGAPYTSPTQPNVPAVGASPGAVIGLTRLGGKQAPPISLQSQNGATWTLSDARGKVVVLTFINAECNDICPVLAKEIIEADRLLGDRRADVDFVVINSDPLETSLTPVPPALTQTGLNAVTNVTFLNGSLTDLSTVWKRYGVTVALDNTDRVVTHNDVMYFVTPAGSLRLSASPFANESTVGTYSLEPTVIHTFARGVADAAAGLLKEPQ
jgi:cytochrome oxidase Cu insertion factor (SCO1/SenC/PrrC family)